MAFSVHQVIYEPSKPYFEREGWARLEDTASRVLSYQLYVLCLDVAIAIFVSGFSRSSSKVDEKGGKSRYFSLMKPEPGRWFLLHAFWNAAITLGTLQDFYSTVKDPIHAVDQDREYNLAPTMMSMSLHLYHCIAPWYFASLSFQDFLHHFVFAICGLGSLSLIWPWGPGSNFAFFFLTGFPGGIDYFLLALVKLKVIDRLTEKRINASLNTWIRGPGCVVSAGWTWACYQSGNVAPPFSAILLQNFLLYCNGQYYAQRVISNYARCDQNNLLLKASGSSDKPFK